MKKNFPGFIKSTYFLTYLFPLICAAVCILAAVLLQFQHWFPATKMHLLFLITVDVVVVIFASLVIIRRREVFLGPSRPLEGRVAVGLGAIQLVSYVIILMAAWYLILNEF